MLPYKSFPEMTEGGWFVRHIFPAKDSPRAELIEEAEKNTGRKVTHVALLGRKGAAPNGLFFMIQDPQVLALCQASEADSSAIERTGVSFVCGAKNVNGDVEVKEYVGIVANVFGWTVTLDPNDHEFRVDFEWEGDSREPGVQHRRDLENLLTALSLKNRLGFEIRSTHWHEISLIDPLRIIVGPFEMRPETVNRSEIENVDRIRLSLSVDLLLDLSQLYREVSIGSRLIYGFSLLVKYFDQAKKGVPILSRVEKKKILKAIRDNVIEVAEDDQKMERIKRALDSTYLEKKNRNERMASSLAPLMEITEDEALEKIRKLATLRGGHAHSSGAQHAQDNDATQDLQFLEEALFKLLTSQSIETDVS